MCDCAKERPKAQKTDVFTDPATAAERESACEVCPMRVKVVEICGVCKCFLPLKRSFKASKCPLGKW